MTDIVAFKGEMEFASASEDDKVGRVVKLRIVKTPEQIGLAHPFATGRRRKAKHPGTRFLSAFILVETGVSAYNGEVMLLGWADGPAGSTVTFLLDAEADSHPFFGCSRVSPGKAGTRFMVAMSEIGDDEVAVRQDQPIAVTTIDGPRPYARTEMHGSITSYHTGGSGQDSATETHHKQTKSNVAALMIKNPRLHDWLRETVRDTDWDSKQADEWLKGVCRISSKRELDKPGPAVERFDRLVREPFVYWQEDQGMFRGGS